MDRAGFWKIIETSLTEAEGDQESQVDLLRERLQALAIKEIVSFDQHFNALWCAAYRQDLWAAAGLISGDRNEVTFMDFRAWLISRGEAVYSEALKSPDSLALVLKDRAECQIEEFQYVALQVWEDKTGKDGLDFPAIEIDHPAKPVGEVWSEADWATKLPALSARFPRKVEPAKPRVEPVKPKASSTQPSLLGSKLSMSLKPKPKWEEPKKGKGKK